MLQRTDFEHRVNWRMARMGFRTPTAHILFDDLGEITPLSNLMLFLPGDRAIDVRALRDWLHNSDNNSGGYQMTGCYSVEASTGITFTGLKFSFIQTIDAIVFRLFWSATIVRPPKYQIS